MNSKNINQEIIVSNQETDYSDISIRSNRKSLTQFSPLLSYYNSSNIYLNRKYSENNNILDIDKSNNFIRKDSLYQNENKQTFSNSEEEEDNISEENNINDNKKLYSNNNNIDKEEYNQLLPNSNYYQTYYENYIPSNNTNIYNNNTNSNITQNIISINQNNYNNNIGINSQQNQIMNFNIFNQFNLVNNINYINRPRFNSTNILNGNYIPPIFSNNITKTNNNNNINNNNNTEMFGRKGWVCSYCNNFNYESRNKCNRCKLDKSPILNSKKKNVGNGIGNINKNIFEGKGQKQFSEREGDWICFNCKNVNFSFRIICNRCQLPKNESDKLLQLNLSLISNNLD